MKGNEIGKARKAARKYEQKKKGKKNLYPHPPGYISDKTRICTHDYSGMLEIDRGPKSNN